MAYAQLTCRLLIAGVFAVAVAGKLRNRAALAEFVASVRAWRVLPGGLVRPVALGVVAGEAAVVVLLAVPGLADAGFGLAGLLLGGFVAATAVVVRRGDRVPCRCFGASTTPLSAAHLWRNSLLLAAAVIGLLAPVAGADEPAGLAVSALAALIGTVLAVFFADIVSLFTDAGLSHEARAAKADAAQRKLQ